MTYPTFAVGEILTAADMNKVGLWLVKTQTVGSTAVSSVTIDNCFTNDYDSYRIVASGITCSNTDTVVFGRLNNHIDTTYSGSIRGLNYAGADVSYNYTNQNAGLLIGATSSTTGFSCDIFSPQKATRKISHGVAATNAGFFAFGSTDSTATARTGITIYPLSGTFQNGTIRVYGYRN
jgi:hypothetical protein